MDQSFKIDDEVVDGVPVVSASGEIDVATAPPLRDRLQALTTSGKSTVVVDLLGVTFLDSTALGVLVGALKRCREAGGDLPLVIDEPRILKVFEITGLTGVFPIFENVRDAVGSVK
ncbi:MAG TPA: STAS domain-containing protein [Acidimicrobiales bacterium]|nr:STAS domain-containing protein [Acidimicrobiales bacterium]